MDSSGIAVVINALRSMTQIEGRLLLTGIAPQPCGCSGRRESISLWRSRRLYHEFDNYMILDFPSKSANEAFARSAVACFAAQMDPTLEELGDIRTAVSEAVTNLHRPRLPRPGGTHHHDSRRLSGAGGQDRDRRQGVGIPDIPRAMEPLFTTGNPEERSGLGFAVMQSFMDKVSVRSAPGRGSPGHSDKAFGGKPST